MIENAIKNVITKTKTSAVMKILSANCSNFFARSTFSVLIDKKDNRLLLMSSIQANPVNSSILDLLL